MIHDRFERTQAAQEKLTGMVQKWLYLSGGQIDKATFRRHAVSGESQIATGAPSPMSPTSRALMSLAPWRDWRATRSRNFTAFSASIRAQSEAELLDPKPVEATAFSCVLRLPSRSARDSLRAALVVANIYPAILWPLEDPAVGGISADAVALSRRLLSIHCDHRYSEGDMIRTADSVIDWVRRQGAQAGAR